MLRRVQGHLVDEEEHDSIRVDPPHDGGQIARTIIGRLEMQLRERAHLQRLLHSVALGSAPCPNDGNPVLTAEKSSPGAHASMGPHGSAAVYPPRALESKTFVRAGRAS